MLIDKFIRECRKIITKEYELCGDVTVEHQFRPDHMRRRLLTRIKITVPAVIDPIEFEQENEDTPLPLQNLLDILRQRLKETRFTPTSSCARR